MLTRGKVQEVASEIEAAAKEVGRRHGLEVKRGSASFNDVSFTLRLVAEVVGEDGGSLAARKEFGDAILFTPLKPEDFGTEFRFRDEMYRLVGGSRRRRKYPLTAERVRDRKRFKFDVETVARAFGREVPIGFGRRDG